MRKKSVFINCMETLTANRKHSEARTLLNAGLKESAERQTAATAVVIPCYHLVWYNIIEQCRISDELHKELDDMKNDVDQKMDLIEYDLRSYRREREE